MSRNYHGADDDCPFCFGIYDPRGMCFQCATPEEIAAARKEEEEEEAARERARAHPSTPFERLTCDICGEPEHAANSHYPDPGFE